MVKKLGVIVNPIAGMGGRVGLKGTDGRETAERARELGARPTAPSRATEALRAVAERLGSEVEVYAAPGVMGEDEARDAGLEPVVVGGAPGSVTTAEDTRRAAVAMADGGVDLLLFAGGDGTARDVHDAIDGGLPVVGMPAGVKMHSGVYANSPLDAASLAVSYLQGELVDVREAEVMDIDEEAFREGRLAVKLWGYLPVPFERSLVQGAKDSRSAGDASALEDIAEDFAERMERGVVYVVGPGTTTRAIAQRLGVEKTLLGVDLVLDGEVVASDVTEVQILEAIEGREARIVVTPIGGQGHIFGRGNQQISPSVIRAVGRDGIVVVASPRKLASLEGAPLLVDTGDAEVDGMLRGYVHVRTGYRTEAVYRVGATSAFPGQS